jgi:predicted RNA-binding Zn-ribbon protein involved in translation (DUF1610 family)
MSIERRIRALFEALAPGCPECGSEDLAFTEYEIEWVDPHEDIEQEFCPRCGEQLTVDVGWEEEA